MYGAIYSPNRFERVQNRFERFKEEMKKLGLEPVCLETLTENPYQTLARFNSVMSRTGIVEHENSWLATGIREIRRQGDLYVVHADKTLGISTSNRLSYKELIPGIIITPKSLNEGKVYGSLDGLCVCSNSSDIFVSSRNERGCKYTQDPKVSYRIQ